MDLLEYAKDLVSKGNTTTQTQAHTAYLQELIQKQPSEIKSEIKPKTAPKNNHKSSNFNAIYLIGGLVLFGTAVLAIGYWLGKRKKIGTHYK
jgi:hypothetical protein